MHINFTGNTEVTGSFLSFELEIWMIWRLLF